jgi:VanZ family protein
MRSTYQNSFQVRETTIYWGPVALWMLLIFVLSAQSSLGEMHGPPLFQVSRKIGHVIEYAVMALLVGRGLIYTWRSRGEALSRRLLMRTWLVGVALCALYAMTDEFHQTFVPFRGGRIEDVVLDTLSAMAALGLWYRFRSRQLLNRDQ